MEKIFTTTSFSLNQVFAEEPLDARGLFFHCFSRLPSKFFISKIDCEKAFKAFAKRYADKITQVYRYDWYDTEKKKVRYWRMLAVLENQIVAEFNQDVCELWHRDTDEDFLLQAVKLIGSFKKRQRRKPLEINLVVRGEQNLDLKPVEVKRTRLDLGLYYNPDFSEIDATIRQRLNRKKDKGIVLLHGLPGTGKTTYLRYLISRIKKRILFVSPSVTEHLMNPEFIELLTSNPETVIIIEDAENVIMDRRHNPRSSVSNLLNISDGLLADFLNVQLICTFNNSLTLIDSALLRKGRLIAKYEFGKLGVEQSQRLSNHFGFDTVISRPMTIAEIAHQNERQAAVDKMEILGFRSHLLTN